MPSNRLIYRIALRPTIGTRFQPTGFPDLGAAVFERPRSDGHSGSADALIVESVQSMANWGERTTWDDATNDQIELLHGLPHVQVVDPDGGFLTSSRLEAHRLASAYIMEGSIDGDTGEKWLGEVFGLEKGRPIDNRRIAAELCRLDPLSLLHGVFFARKSWPWQPKVARVLTCFIEAYGVRQAVSGGVKKDSVDTSGGSTDTGYGMVPHQRVEYTADSIVALAAVDLDQIRSFGIGEDGEELLAALAAFELATLFSGCLRLRTACDLEVIDVDGDDLPALADASSRVVQAIGAAAGRLGPVRQVAWASRSAKAKK